MKTLKFDHQSAQEVLAGRKTATWRLYDDKDLSVNDEIRIVDKLDPKAPKTWRIIGVAKVNEIVEKKLGDVTEKDMAGHEVYASQEEMLQTYRGRYGLRVNLDVPVKMVYFSFTPTDGDVPSGGMLLEEAKLYTDGGSRGNPGDSAAAFVICKPDNTVVEKSGAYLGLATNNQAEYYGFIRGLERAQDLGIDKVNLFSDSQLVVNQMKGIFKVKNQELAPLHQQAKELADSFEEVSFTYVPREMNKTADGEVNRILDAAERNKRKR